jgi:hypothetical protein
MTVESDGVQSIKPESSHPYSSGWLFRFPNGKFPTLGKMIPVRQPNNPWLNLST